MEIQKERLSVSAGLRLDPVEVARIPILCKLLASCICDGDDGVMTIETGDIINAFQFDPLYGVSVSQVDSLPHQIEAVYHHILKNPSIRFLLADDPGAGKTIMAGLLYSKVKETLQQLGSKIEEWGKEKQPD